MEETSTAIRTLTDNPYSIHEELLGTTGLKIFMTSLAGHIATETVRN